MNNPLDGSFLLYGSFFLKYFFRRYINFLWTFIFIILWTYISIVNRWYARFYRWFYRWSTRFSRSYGWFYRCNNRSNDNSDMTIEQIVSMDSGLYLDLFPANFTWDLIEQVVSMDPFMHIFPANSIQPVQSLMDLIEKNIFTNLTFLIK